MRASIAFAAALAALAAGSCRADRQEPAVDAGGAGGLARAAEDPKKKLVPFEPPASAARASMVELGAMLFFDPRLSGDGDMSCATCHDPKKGFADGLPTAVGHKGKVLARNTPSLVNAEHRKPLFWDGRAATVE